MMFFLKDEFLHEFMKISSLPSSKPVSPVPAAVHSVNERLLSYIASLKPYFEEPEGIQELGASRAQAVVMVKRLLQYVNVI